MSAAWTAGYEFGKKEGYSKGLKLGNDNSAEVLRELVRILTEALTQVKKASASIEAELENTS